MRILIFGDGCARDHATFRRLRSEGHDARFALVGPNAILAKEAGVHRVAGAADAVTLARHLAVDLAVVLGPGHILAGAVDAFQAAGVPCFGPTAAMAAVEASKAVGKDVMRQAGIVTPESHLFDHLEAAEEFLCRVWRENARWVIKAETFLANAAWRTVVPVNLDAARAALHYLLRDGPASDRTNRVMLERRVVGEELSLHVLSDGRDYRLLPPVCDYKRLDEGDTGPNTHGMGAVASTHVDAWRLLDGLSTAVVEPTLDILVRRGHGFTGVLYIGLIRTESGYQTLEFNARPGNPEWLALLGLLRSPLGEVMEAVATGRLRETPMAWHTDQVGMGLFAVAGDYPFAAPDQRTPLSLANDTALLGEDVHAAMDGSLLAGSNRVVAALARGPDVEAARAACLQTLGSAVFDGAKIRRDIGVGGLLGTGAIHTAIQVKTLKDRRI
ncbi:phosphoribosylamine--glycine ligase [Rhodospirillum sp. A1_3_36]|uniref:phosphoribosylamine--glycine ligase n=1 Tax=Rhodospirillum sp. A1_3_36 TaxID=3391666 RepID=UPI0039A731C5